MTFEFVNEAISNLNTLAKKDKKYKSITDPLKKMLHELQTEFLSFKEAHLKVTVETKSLHEELKSKHQKSLAQLEETFTEFEVASNQKMQDLQTKKEQGIEVLNQKISLEIDKLNSELQDLETTLQSLNKSTLLARSKDLSYIDKVIAEIKKQSAQAMAQIKQKHDDDLAAIDIVFASNVQKIEANIQTFLETIKRDKDAINHSKTLYRNQSDSKYLSIKSDYHQASTLFNQMVDQLKKQKEQAEKKLKKEHQDALKPIEKDLTLLEKNYSIQKEKIEKTYQSKIQDHKVAIVQIIESYNQKKEKIIQETSESISLINSKLSTFREVIIKEREERQKEYKELRENATNEDQRKTLYKEYQQFITFQDVELNKQIQRAKKDTLQKNKAQYEKLYEAELAFLEQRAKWRIDGKILLINQKLESYYNEQNYQYQVAEIENKIKKLQTILEHELDLIGLKYLEHLAPREKDLSIANAISERDINLLSNDTNYHLAHFSYKEEVLDIKTEIYKLEQQALLDAEKLTLEFNKERIQMTEQLLLEKETVIRDQKLKSQTLKKDLVLHTFEVTNLTNELEYLLSKNDVMNQINYKIKEQQLLNNFFHDETDIQAKTLKIDKSFEQEKIYFFDQLSEIDLELEILNKELDVIHSRIHYLFNQIYVVYNIHHHFMLKLIELYQLPAHPEHVKLYITLYLDVFRYLSQIQTAALDEFLVDMQSYHETRINDLTSQHYESNLKVLTTTYQNDLKVFDEETSKIQLQIHKIDHHMIVLSSNVDRIQSKINQLEIKQSQTGDKKEIKQYQNDIEELQKQINSIESEMSGLDKEIQKFNKPLDKINKKKQSLLSHFETQKELLLSEQQKDTKIYFQQLTFYKNLMRKMSHLFHTYETRLEPLTLKLNQPLYLTDQMMTEYQKNFKRLESLFEKQSHELYQALLKGSIQLFHALSKDQESLKTNFLKEQSLSETTYQKNKQQSELSILSLKDKLNNMLATLKDEKALSLETQNTQVKKDKLNHLESLKSNIKSIENQIMQTEDKIQNELLLIDSNLKSVLNQLENEYQKNVLRNQEQRDKNILKMKDQRGIKEKNLKQLEESTQLKNNLLNTRFGQAESRILEQLKVKSDNLHEQMKKRNELFDKKLDELNIDLKTSFQRKETYITSFQKKSEVTAHKIENDEKRILDKDTNDAQKSYQFKMKTLKL